jgi:hypothetical protein
MSGNQLGYGNSFNIPAPQLFGGPGGMGAKVISSNQCPGPGYLSLTTPSRDITKWEQELRCPVLIHEESEKDIFIQEVKG